jgi:hypothetical protein
MDLADFGAVTIATMFGGQSRIGEPIVETMEKIRQPDETAFEGPFG